MPATHDEISILAYRFWQERGAPAGSPEVDWGRAEATLQLKAVTLVQNALDSESAANRNDGNDGAKDELSAFETERVASTSATDTTAANASQLPQQGQPTKTARSAKRKSAVK